MNFAFRSQDLLRQKNEAGDVFFFSGCKSDGTKRLVIQMHTSIIYIYIYVFLDKPCGSATQGEI